MLTKKHGGVKHFALFAFIFITLFTGCASITNQKKLDFSYIENESCEFDWEALSPGIVIAHLRYKNYPLTVHAVKIDLPEPSLQVTASEPHLFDLKNGTVRRETVLSFAKRNNTAVSVNAAFFKTGSLLFSPYAKPLGVHIYEGRILNPQDKRYGAVHFTAEKRAFITDSQETGTPLEGVTYAVSGFKMILKNGTALHTGIHPKEDSRTCIGVADEGRTVILFFAEAENRRKSRGVTYDLTAFFMKKLGASDALHLDGGGSSSLIIKKNGTFKTVVPSSSIFGLRKTATNLGFVYKKAE